MSLESLRKRTAANSKSFWTWGRLTC